MAKEISGFIKLQIKGGQANPAPPVGPALGQRGVNIMEFCKAFNDKTKSMAGKPVPVEITVYKDKKFDFKIKSPPASFYIKEAVKLKGGSKEPGRNIVASISKKQLESIAKEKMNDLNAHDIEEASSISCAFKSFIFSFAILSNCFLEIEATIFLPGSLDPPLSFTASLI